MTFFHVVDPRETPGVSWVDGHRIRLAQTCSTVCWPPPGPIGMDAVRSWRCWWRLSPWHRRSLDPSPLGEVDRL